MIEDPQASVSNDGEYVKGEVGLFNSISFRIGPKFGFRPPGRRR